jgi:hypothetical protein
MSDAWPFVIVQARVLLAPGFLSDPGGGYGTLVDAARTGSLDQQDTRTRVIEMPGRGAVTLCFRRVQIQGAYVGRGDGLVRDEATRPMMMTEGVAMLGQREPIACDVLELGRDQVLSAVRAYVDDPGRRPAVIESVRIGQEKLALVEYGTKAEEKALDVEVPLPPTDGPRRPARVLVAVAVLAAAIVGWLIWWVVSGRAV